MKEGMGMPLLETDALPARSSDVSANDAQKWTEKSIALLPLFFAH